MCVCVDERVGDDSGFGQDILHTQVLHRVQSSVSVLRSQAGYND